MFDKQSAVYYVVHMTQLGSFIRKEREARATRDRTFSLRQVATRIHVEPSYLSKVERGEVEPPSEETIKRLAKELDQDADVMLAMAGKVSRELQKIVIKRPQLFAELLRQLRNAPDGAVLRVVREVRDGKW